MLPHPNARITSPAGILLIVLVSAETAQLRRFQVFIRHGGAGAGAQHAARLLLEAGATDRHAMQDIRALYVRHNELIRLTPETVIARLERDLTDGAAFAAFYLPVPAHNRFAVTKMAETSYLLADPAGMPDKWSRVQRIAAMIRRIPENLPVAIRGQVAGLFTPQAMALLALMLAALAVGQFYGVGEVVDVYLAGLAWYLAGWSGLLALRDFVGAIIDAAGARRLADLEAAARQAANSCVTLGVAFLTLVFLRARDQENVINPEQAPVAEELPPPKTSKVEKGWWDESKSIEETEQTTSPRHTPDDLQSTLDRINKGESFPHRNDGAIFRNREGLLPSKTPGYYREYVHPTPGISGPGAQRIIIGQGGEKYFSPDHYQTFIPLK